MEIRRYPNRKLYMRGGYISLARVAELLRAGQDVQVLESTTGRDVTAYTMAQLIAQEAEHGRRFGVEETQALKRVVCYSPKQVAA